MYLLSSFLQRTFQRTRTVPGKKDGSPPKQVTDHPTGLDLTIGVLKEQMSKGTLPPDVIGYELFDTMQELEGGATRAFLTAPDKIRRHVIETACVLAFILSRQTQTSLRMSRGHTECPWGVDMQASVHAFMAGKMGTYIFLGHLRRRQMVGSMVQVNANWLPTAQGPLHVSNPGTRQPLDRRGAQNDWHIN